MKYMLLFMLLISLVAPLAVFGNEPNDEVTCCYDLRDYPESDVAKECVTRTNVTAESCSAIIGGWEDSMREFTAERARMQEIIAPCCVEVMRGRELNEECSILSLDKEICEPIASTYLSQNQGIPLLSDPTKLMIGLLIIAGIVWFIRRKRRK